MQAVETVTSPCNPPPAPVVPPVTASAPAGPPTPHPVVKSMKGYLFVLVNPDG